MPKFALANSLWLGRHLVLLRSANLGRQLLLALARVVSTKVHLSSKGKEEAVRQQATSWRKKFLQTGMQGTSIVFGNGDASEALAEFPPSEDVLQDSFVAVFTGPDNPSPAESRIINGNSESDAQARTKMAQMALRKEIQLHVEKHLLDEQATYLMKTNYVYNEDGRYRQDLVEAMPEGKHLPSALEAIATFVKVDDTTDNVMQDHGPASSTTGATHEKESAEEFTGRVMSVMDENLEEAMESSKLPILQTLLERMENQAGRVLANELSARTEEGDYDGRDDVGRNRLKWICQEFHTSCAKISREDELKNLEWKIQCLETNKFVPPPLDTDTARGGPSDPHTVCSADASTTHKKAKLRVPTNTKALSWWDPKYWSLARPTEFCYGDCVWGLEKQEESLSVLEWAWMLWRREELEYTLPGEPEPFIARPINRFRENWYVLHLVASFWQRTETTKSIHTFLKTPGAFGYTKALADLSPDMLQDAILNAQIKGQKPSVQSLLTDKDVPTQLRQALHALHQSTANVMGSNGHRRLLQKEGVAYTLAFSAPLLFTTMNPADTKQPLLLVVQGGNIRIEEPLPGFREMTERLASDPAGQTFVFELLVRCFFVCVLGVRHECIGWKRGSTDNNRKDWCTDGVAHDAMASTIFGWIRAAFGPIEAQGRGSLHPHILAWLLDISVGEAIELLSRDRGSFRSSIREWMFQVAASVAAVQETSVTELCRTWGIQNESAPMPPLPLGPKEQKGFHADGKPETTTDSDVLRSQVAAADETLYFNVPGSSEDSYEEAMRPSMPLRDGSGQEVDLATWTTNFAATKQSIWSQSISDTAAGRQPKYCLQHDFWTSHNLNETVAQELQDALPSEAFIQDVCKDARDLVIGSAVHLCSPSCWKYHSSKLTQICRHGFYHVVILTDWNGTVLKRRRQGKHLYGCLAICRDTRFGMAGRIITFQTHPYECPTNYAAIVAMRCNIDVQDLRRVPPPKFWMLPEELEPEVISSEEERHVHYPQRLSEFSLGSQNEWGWMKHLATTSESRAWTGSNMEWPSIFQRLSEGLEDALPSPATLASDDVDGIRKACTAAAMDMFVDAHNAGYYINSYTTKVNATMDTVLRNLMEGIRNLHTTWQDKIRESANSQATDPQISKRQESFRKAMQTLNRLDTSFRRASWKSGCEMLFPILFGHMSFQTHRCWCVFVRRAIWLSAESWRRFYGQMASLEEATGATVLQFHLPQGTTVQLPEGWTMQLQSPGQQSYIDPNGASYTADDMLEVAAAMLEQSACTSKKPLQQIMKTHLDKLRLEEGSREDTLQSSGHAPPKENQAISKATYHGYDQLDDWHYRGTHPILVNMPLYEYSRWVYRVEYSPWAAASAQAPRHKPKHVDIPFHEDYMLGKTWIQRLSREPRVPRIEGMKFHSEANAEMHYLLKSLLLRPIHILPEGISNAEEQDSRMLKLLRAYQAFCTSANKQKEWHACGGAGPGPFEKSYAEFRSSMEKLAHHIWKPSVGQCYDFVLFPNGIQTLLEILC